MKSQHTISTTLTIDAETEIDVEITYTFTPGCPARGPSYASGGEPADPAELELLSVCGEFGRPVGEAVTTAADAWLQDRGYAEAVDQATWEC